MKKVLIWVGVLVLAVVGFMAMQFMGMQQAKAKQAKEAEKNFTAVKREDIANRVVETGTIDAVKSVEVKSRVTGRLKRLLVDEGDTVSQGQVIAIIDPQETELQVRQQQAQLRGAVSSVARASIEIEQRRKTSVAAVRQAEIRLAQLRAENKAQPTLTRASITQARTTLESAETEVSRLQTTAQPNARSADAAAMREAKANLDNANSEYERQKNLFDQGYTAYKLVENAALAVELARARMQQAQDSHDRLEGQLKLEMARAQDDLRRARAGLEQAQASSYVNTTKGQDVRNAEVELMKARAALADVDALIQSRIQSQASVEQLRSSLDDGLRQLRETEIRAPMGGVVTKKMTQEGELVAGLSQFSAGTSIVRLEDRRSLRVIMSLNEIDTAKVSEGMPAVVTVDALPEATFKGSVRKIAPASMAVGTQVGQTADTVVKYQLEIWLDSTDPRLRSGMSAKCDLEVAKKTKVLVLPLDFVFKDKTGAYVDVASSDPKGKPTRKKVKLGIQTGAKVEVLEGVTEGEKLARPDQKVPPRSGFMGGGGGDSGDDGGGM